MAYDFKIGKFINGVGLEKALAGVDHAVLAAADVQAARLKGAFVFGGHGNRGGEQWQPWSSSYAKQAAHEARTGRRHPSLMILYRTGQMRASIGPRVISASGPEHVINIEASPSYSSIHQYGAGRVPARPFLVVTSQDQQVFDTRLGSWLREALNGPVSAWDPEKGMDRNN